MRAPGSNITCSIQDALSPALVPKPLEFAHNILHHRGTACCTIQESFHLHPQLYQHSCAADCPNQGFAGSAQEMTVDEDAHVLQQDPGDPSAVLQGPLQQPEDMLDEACCGATHAALQASAAYIYAWEACRYQLGVLHMQKQLSCTFSPAYDQGDLYT